MTARGSSAVAALALGCGAPDPPSSAGDSGAEPTGSGRFPVSGVVLGLDDQPVVDVFVTVSTEFCIPDRTDTTGAFTVAEVGEGDKRLITYGETASNGLVASVVFAFEAAEARVFDAPIRTPAFSELWPVDPDAADPQQLTTDDGLHLTLEPGALTLAPFAPAELQVARVPVEQAPPFVPTGVALTDLFALGPIQSILDPPAPMRFPADPDLAPGAAVVFHALDYDTGLLVPIATGTVDAEHRPGTDAGEGLPELTWVGVAPE